MTIKKQSLSLLRGVGVAFAGAVTLLSLSSCGGDNKDSDESSDKPEAKSEAAPKAKPKDAPKAGAQPAEGTTPADADIPELEAAKAAVLEDALYGMGPDLTAGMTAPYYTVGIPSPECWDKVCIHLEKLETYYKALAASGTPAERVRLAVRIAQLKADLKSQKLALEWFKKAREEYDAMGEADKNSPNGKELLCTIEEGIFSNTPLNVRGENFREEADALRKHLDAAFTLRKELLQAVVPGDDGSQLDEMTPEISSRLDALMRDVTRTASMQVALGDRDEACKTLRECLAYVGTFRNVTFRVRLQQAYMYRALGNCEYGGGDGDPEAALRSWYTAKYISEGIYRLTAQGNSVASLGFALEAKRLYGELDKVTKTVSDNVTDESGEAEGGAPAASEEAPAQ